MAIGLCHIQMAPICGPGDDRSGGNRLLVVEGATNSLKDIHLKSGKVKTIGRDLGFQQAVPGLPPTAFINDVEVGPNGTVYVNSDGANVIFQIGDEKVSGKPSGDLRSIFAAAIAIAPDNSASDAGSTPDMRRREPSGYRSNCG